MLPLNKQMQAEMICSAQDLIYFHWLKELFNNLLKTPFEIPDDDGSDITRAFFNAEREGLLTKEGVRFLFISDPWELHLSMVDQFQRRLKNVISTSVKQPLRKWQRVKLEHLFKN